MSDTTACAQGALV